VSESLIVPGDLFARTQTINGLRRLANFLEANPAVPVREYGHELVFHTRHCTDDAQRHQVEAVASLLGVEVIDNSDQGGRVYASRTFGRITYEICHMPQHSRDRIHARLSYENNIVLDADQAA
jgi:hypothetical protein